MVENGWLNVTELGVDMSMPAGKYYIGDLCYVMTDEEWEEYCTLTTDGTKFVDGEFQFKDGRAFATYGTKYGDGVYYDEYGFSYSVDSGGIGCILVKDIRKKDTEDRLDFGAVMKFEKDFVTGGGRGTEGWQGDIQFGHIIIETDEKCHNMKY